MRAAIKTSGVSVYVTDEIQHEDCPQGQAGFGLEIVRLIARLLDAKFTLKPNLTSIEFSIA